MSKPQSKPNKNRKVSLLVKTIIISAGIIVLLVFYELILPQFLAMFYLGKTINKYQEILKKEMGLIESVSQNSAKPPTTIEEYHTQVQSNDNFMDELNGYVNGLDKLDKSFIDLPFSGYIGGYAKLRQVHKDYNSVAPKIRAITAESAKLYRYSLAFGETARAVNAAIANENSKVSAGLSEYKDAAQNTVNVFNAQVDFLAGLQLSREYAKYRDQDVAILKSISQARVETVDALNQANFDAYTIANDKTNSLIKQFTSTDRTGMTKDILEKYTELMSALNQLSAVISPELK